MLLLRWLWLPLLLCAIALAVWALWDQKSAPPARRIALISLTPVDAATQEGFRLGLRELGYDEGEQIVFDHAEPAGSIERLEPVIEEKLARSPDLLFVSSTPATQAAMRLTEKSKRPIIFAPVNDPVAAGVVASLAKPGGHLTGVRLAPGDAMRLWWLHELAPQARRVLVPYTVGDRSAQRTLEQIRPLAGRLGLDLVEQPLDDASDIDRLLQALPPGIDAIFLPRDSSVEAQIRRWVKVANQQRLPLSAPAIAQVSVGALFSYGFQHREIGRQAARLADQVLRGIPPGDLPVEAAENILAINLATARSIGLHVSDAVLARAGFVVRETPQP